MQRKAMLTVFICFVGRSLCIMFFLAEIHLIWFPITQSFRFEHSKRKAER